MSVDQLPSYLTNPVVLIRALKSPADPPVLPAETTASNGSSSSTQSPSSALRKIDIATLAWNDTRCQIWKRNEIIGEWVVDSWTKCKVGSIDVGEGAAGKKGKGKGKASSGAGGLVVPSLLDERYHQIMAEIIDTTTLPFAIPLPQLMTSFFTLLHSAPITSSTSADDTNLLVRAAHKTFLAIKTAKLLATRSQANVGGSTEKAEDWLEALGACLKWTAAAEATGQSGVGAETTQGIMDIIKAGLEDGLRSNLTRKKLTMTNLKPHLPSIILATTTEGSSLRAALQSMLPGLLFPLEVLQSAPTYSSDVTTPTAWSSIVDNLILPVSGQADLTPAPTILQFIPVLFTAYTSALKTHRFSLFTSSHSQPKSKGGASGEIPLDVWVMSKVREGTLPGCRGSLDVIKAIEAESLVAEAIDMERWRAIRSVWVAVSVSGSYFEAESGWREEMKRTMGMLKEALAKDSEVAEELLEVSRILIDLDYDAVFNVEEAYGRKILGKALTSSSQRIATELLLSILKFHTLTQDLPSFFRLLADSISENVSKTSAGPSYAAIGTGAFTSYEFLDALNQALQGSFAGGISAERGWGKIMLDLGKRMQGNVTTENVTENSPATKKRKTKEGVRGDETATNANGVTYALLSRLMYAALISARGRGTGVELDGSSAEVLKIVEEVSSCWNALSDGDGSLGGIVAAARERLTRAAADLGFVRLNVISATDKKRKRQEVGEYTWESVQTTLAECASADLYETGVIVHGIQAEPTSGSSTQTWSGRLASIRDDQVGPAVWQLVSQYGLSHIELNGADDDLKAVAIVIMRHPALSRVEEELSCSTPSTYGSEFAVTRVLHSAEFWELPRLRAAIMNVARTIDEVSAEPTTLGRMYSFFSIAPPGYISAAVRSQIGSRATVLLRSSQGVSRRDVTRYLLRAARSSDFLGDLEHLTAIFSNASSSNSTAVDDSANNSDRALLLQLQTEYLRILTRDIKMPSVQLLADGILDSASKQLQTSQVGNDGSSSTVTMIIDAFASKSGDTSVPDSIKSKVRKLADSLWSKTTFAIQSWTGHLSGDTADLLQTVVVLSRSHSDAGKESTLRAFWPKAFRAILAQAREGGQLDSSLACGILDLQVELDKPQSVPSGAAKWLAAWLALRSASVSVRAIGIALDAHFANTLATFTPDPYALVLSLLNDELSSASHTRGPITDIHRSSLIAVGLMMQSVVPGTGKANRANLDGILDSLMGLLEAKEVVVVGESLACAAIIAKEKAASLIAQDVSTLLAMALRVLRPITAGTQRHGCSLPNILSSIISITNSLVRQRRDLVVEMLPLLMAVYARIFPLFGFPRRSGDGIGRAQKKVLESWPAWISADSSEWIGKTEAREFARALAALSGRSIVRNMADNSATPVSGTMVGELSKHAPALLVAYTRAVASPHSTISLDIRRELEPGLFAVCEAVTSGGKALFGIKGGESSGDAFGLGDGDNVDAEWEIWGDLWRRWRGKRYTGGG